VNKLGSMFKDIALSKDLMIEFKDTPQARTITEEHKVEFVAEVLTNGYWPEQGEVKCALPPEMKAITVKFE